MTTLKFTDEELKIIGAALGQLPYHAVAGIIANIQRQVTENQPKSSE